MSSKESNEKFYQTTKLMECITALWQLAVKGNTLDMWRSVYHLIAAENTTERNVYYDYVYDDLDFLQSVVFQIYADLEKEL